MKPIVRFSLLIAVMYFLSGCVKAVIIPVPQNPVVGSWILTGASEGDPSGWSSFNTGVENGVFDLYSNGAAQYSDTQLNMQGHWDIANVSGGYYDEYGSFFNGPHQQMELHLDDNSTHSSIDLSFDYVSFYGNRFVATYFNGSLIERYFFQQY